MSDDTEFRKKLARLRALIAIKDAQLMANPKPYLEDMAKRCHELLKVLEEVDHALSPDYVFQVWDEQFDKNHVPRPQDIQGEALFRCNKALDVLRKYRSS
ncbi:MAG: hypothetical protein EP323_01280 [Gammaproteobacteria bacterium]|nr:MAG: hypothetical protein EP323_01280 [Gammaproteobacteria bacterium]